MTILRIFAFTVLCLLLTMPQSFADEVADEITKEQEERKFFAQYDQWLPERLIDLREKTTNGLPPEFTNLPDKNTFRCGGYLENGERTLFFYYLTFFENRTHLCPFPEWMLQLAESGYETKAGGVPLYSVFPMYGRFYLLDCPEGIASEHRWNVSAFRLKKNEEPKGIKLQRKSIVFLCITPEQYTEKKGYSGSELYGYTVNIEDVPIQSHNAAPSAIKIWLRHLSRGMREDRECICKIGGVLEFSHFGHKIINIVAPQELKDPIRGHKCFLVGYVELDPTPIPLANPHWDEITEPPESERIAEETKDIPVPPSVDGKEKEPEDAEAEETESGIGLLSGTILCVVIVLFIGWIVLFLRKA